MFPRGARIAPILVALLALAATAPAVHAAPVVDQSHLSAGVGYRLAESSEQLGQSFTAGRSGPLHHLRLVVNVSRDCVQPDATVALHPAVGGLPSGAALASGSISQSSIGSGPGLATATVDVTLSPAPLLAAGTQYAIVLSAPGSPSGVLCGPDYASGYGWVLTSTDSYAGGNRSRSLDGGATWEVFTLLGVVVDHLFAVFIDDTIAPAPTLTTPAHGTLTSDDTPSFGGVAGTAVGDSKSLVEVEISAGTTPGTVLHRLNADPDDTTGAYAATAPALTDGTYTARARQTDDASNVGYSVPVTFTVDTTPPAAPGLTGTTPASPSPENAIVVTGSTEAGSTVQVFQTATCSGPPVAGTAAELAGAGIALTVPADQTTQISARATDAAGNVGPCSAAIAYTEDSTAPDAPQLTALAPDSPSPSADVTVTGTAEPGSTVRLYQTGDCSGPATTVTAAAFAAGVPETVPEDTTTAFSATATDAAGNVSPCSASRSYTEDSTAPQTTIDAGPADDALIAERRPRFAFSSSEAGSTFACRLDGGPARACDGGTFTPAGDLAAGRHRFSVAATDAAGNTDATPATRSFTVSVPGPPSVPPPPAPPPPSPPRAATAADRSPQADPTLRLDLQGDRPQLLTEKRDVSVVVGCGPVACTIGVDGRVSVPGRAAVLRTRATTVSLRPWQLKRVRLRTTKALRRSVRKAMRSGRRVTVQIGVTIRVAGQPTVKRQARVRVRALRGSRAS